MRKHTWLPRGVRGAALPVCLSALGALGALAPSLGCNQILGVEGDPVLASSASPAATVAPGSGKCVGTIRVRITTDDTGTATDIAPPYVRGVWDYLRNINDTEGGLRGCTIDVDVKDAHYDPAVTEQVVEAWRQQPEWPEVSTVFVFGTGPTTRVGPKLMDEKKVVIPGSYAGSLASPSPVTKDLTFPDFNADGDSAPSTTKKSSPGWPYVFFPATDYSTAIRIGIQAAWKIAPGKMAMVHEIQDKCLYCVDPLAAGKSYVEQLPKMALAPDIIVPQTSKPEDEPLVVGPVTDYFKKEIEKKKADPSYQPVTWLWSGNSVFSSSLVGKAAYQAQQLVNQAFPDPKDQWKIRVIANNWGIGETTPSICGSACAGIFYGLFPVPRYGDVQNASGMNQMMNIHDTYRQKDGDPAEKYRDVRYVQGFAAALMWRKGMEQAIDAGHSPPSGDDLKNALESFHEVVLDGMTAGPIAFTDKDHRPQSNEAVYVIDEQGNLQFVDRYSITLDPSWLGY